MGRLPKNAALKVVEKGKKNELSSAGRDEKEETLEKWYRVATLYVLRGMTQTAAVRAVYGSDGCYAGVLFKNSRFLALVDRLRAVDGLGDDDVRKNIEALYLQTIVDPNENPKLKLQAAQQWQKLRGLETQKVELRSDVDDLILAQLQKCEEAMLNQTEMRLAKGRCLKKPELPDAVEAPVELGSE